MVLLSGFVVAGAYLDAWAHRHVARLETLFTPWHGVLYGGVFLTGSSCRLRSRTRVRR